MRKVSTVSKAKGQTDISNKHFFSNSDITAIIEGSGPIFKTIIPSMLKEVIDILSKHFDTNIQIKSISRLSEPKRRNLICRIVFQSSSTKAPTSLIFKQFLPKKYSKNNKDALNRFARDSAAHAFLNNLETESLYVPRLYGSSTKSHFVLLEDLGETHVSLVDSLTGKSANEAKAALERFMRRLGQLHADSYGQTNNYLKTLSTINPDIKLWKNDLKITLNDIVAKLESLSKNISILYTTKMQIEIYTVIKEVLQPGPFITFIHGDICPDNVFDNPKKNALHLIDFEWSGARSALLDGTYLRMSMPNCWCAHTIPENLVDSLEVIYRKELMKRIPQARDDEAYHTAYTYACAYWMLQTILQVETLIDKDYLFSSAVSEKTLWKQQTNIERPRVLSRLKAFIDVAKKYNTLPHIRSMAASVLEDLKVRWHDSKPLDIYTGLEGYNDPHNLDSN